MLAFDTIRAMSHDFLRVFGYQKKTGDPNYSLERSPDSHLGFQK